MTDGSPRCRYCKRKYPPNNTLSFPRKRESRGGCPQYRLGFSYGKRRKQIPAFAGMTSICKSARFLHTLFRGNDEVLFDGYFLLQYRRLGDPSVTMRGARFLHTPESGNDEVLPEGCRLPRRRFSGAPTIAVRDVGLLYALEGGREKVARRLYSSSFPRKRESGGGRPQYRRGFSYGNAAKRFPLSRE